MLNEVKIIAGQMIEHRVLQSDRIGRIDRDGHIGTNLSRVSQYVGKSRKDVVAQLNHVVRGLEVSDGVFADGTGEDKCIVSAISKEDLIGRGTCERIVAGCAFDNIGRRWTRGNANRAITIEILVETGLQ